MCCAKVAKTNAEAASIQVCAYSTAKALNISPEKAHSSTHIKRGLLLESGIDCIVYVGYMDEETMKY